MATGHLGTIVGTSTNIALNVISITPGEESVDPIAAPYLGLALGAGIPYDEPELVEGGEYTVVYEDTNNVHIVDQASATTGTGVTKALRKKQTWTWTKPAPSGLTNGATRVFSGIVTSVQENEQMTGQRSTITVKIKVAGTVTKAAAS